LIKTASLYEARGLVTRKQFGVLLGAGVAMMLPRVANAVAVTEGEGNVTTPDGTAACYFVHPSSTAPGVLVWPDIFGLRPAFRQMGKRLAESGYSVLVVNPFYRVKKAPTAEAGAPTPIQQLMPLAPALNETTHMTDAQAFIGWLDEQTSVAKNRKIGTQGYCMGGPIAFRTAAAVPDRVGAVASIHSGGLVTEAPNSPHLQAAKTRAQFLIAIADNDDKRSPNEKTVLKETFEKVNLPAEIEVYAGAAHGWCPPDRRSTTSHRPRRHEAACSRCTEKLWPEHRLAPRSVTGHLAWPADAVRPPLQSERISRGPTAGVPAYPPRQVRAISRIAPCPTTPKRTYSKEIASTGAIPGAYAPHSGNLAI
jgi:carboxymethylenebutenolidase